LPIVEAREVSKRFFLRHNPSGSLKVHFLALFSHNHKEQIEEFWAVRDLSLRIGRGESIGLIGRNGSGKSTFLKMIAAIHQPTSGQLLVERGARIGSMIELGVGFHPELTGTENVGLNAAIYGLSQAEIDALYPAIVRYSGLEHFMDVPLKNYSSGMHMRLGFAIAANLSPDLLLLDEVFAVGDFNFQRQCLRTLQTFQSEGKTIIFVSHSPEAIRSICRRVCVLDRGRLMYDGDVEEGLAMYERLMTAPVAAPGAPEPRAIQSALDLTDEELDLGWHRLAVGGKWRESGEWRDPHCFQPRLLQVEGKLREGQSRHRGSGFCARWHDSPAHHHIRDRAVDARSLGDRRRCAGFGTHGAPTGSVGRGSGFDGSTRSVWVGGTASSVGPR